MSCRNNPPPPNSSTQDASSCDSTSTTCPPCCCCVTSASIQNIRAYNDGSRFGHEFDFVIQMNFAAGSSGTSDCTLEWWEKTNIPAVPGHPPNTWTELYAVYAVSPTFDPWKNRTVACPAGGSSTVTIMDPPGLGIRPGRTARRTLEFRLVVKSGAGCSCSQASASATATQILEITNGVPNHPGSFTTP
jgi:hypothetical protein